MCIRDRLDSVYPIVWMDAIHYKVTDERGCAVTRAIYNVLSIDREGHKELLGIDVYKRQGTSRQPVRLPIQVLQCERLQPADGDDGEIDFSDGGDRYIAGQATPKDVYKRQHYRLHGLPRSHVHPLLCNEWHPSRL